MRRGHLLRTSHLLPPSRLDFPLHTSHLLTLQTSDFRVQTFRDTSLCHLRIRVRTPAIGLSGFRSFRIRRRRVPEVRQQRPQAALLAGDSVQGLGLVHHRLRQKERQRGFVVIVQGREQGRDEEREDGAETKSEVVGQKPATTSSNARIKPAGSDEPRRRIAPRPAIQIDRLQILGELRREIRPAQREVHHRLQKPELVAGVVPDAVDLAAVDRAILQEPAHAVGQLDFTSAVALGGFEDRKDVRRQDVAADDRQIRRRFGARRLLHHVADLVDAGAGSPRRRRCRSC